MDINQYVADDVTRPGKMKILALDGGGIRGLITVEVLAEIERVLSVKTGKGANFVLADFFDFFAGTSTGALIACCLARRMSMERIRRFHTESGKQMFTKNSLLARLNAL